MKLTLARSSLTLFSLCMTAYITAGCGKKLDYFDMSTELEHDTETAVGDAGLLLDTGTGVQSDADSDADIDTATNSDTVSDTDTATDSDTAGDTNTGTESDSTTGSEANIGSDSESPSDSEEGTDSRTGEVDGGNVDGGDASDTETQTHSEFDTNMDAGVATETDTETETETATETDTYLGNGACGDGILDIQGSEECDDGNTDDDDGCSSLCEEESGYGCTQPTAPEFIAFPIVYRDFNDDHDDFEPFGTNNQTHENLLGDQLVNGKPVFIGEDGEGLITDAESFSQWYRSVPGTNAEIESELTLWSIGDGAYVNRYGPDGEKWDDLRYEWCGNSDENKNSAECAEWPHSYIPCDTIPDNYEMELGVDLDGDNIIDEGLVRCIVNDNGSRDHTGVFIDGRRNGNPIFFPVDDQETAFTPLTDYEPASPPAGYAASGEPSRDPTGEPHNFHFTSELRVSFYYDASKTYEIQFTGDDDVWLFVNGTLAIDLGGIHNPVFGSVELNDSTAEDFGIFENGVYEVAFFHAERHRISSSYKLTLTGFQNGASVCTPND